MKNLKTILLLLIVISTTSVFAQKKTIITGEIENIPPNKPKSDLVITITQDGKITKLEIPKEGNLNPRKEEIPLII